MAHVSTTSANQAAGKSGEVPADRGRGRKARDNIAGWGFVAPFAVLFLVFLAWPIAYGGYLSFTDLSLAGSGGDLVGFTNYAEAFTDPDMWQALRNTLVFTIMSTVPLVLVAMALALLVNIGLPGQWLWRLAFFLPFLLASTVVAMIWSWMYNPQLGLLNDFLATFGVDNIAWLQDEQYAMLSVVITTVWWTVGFNFLLYLAALQNIPDQLYEAASVDGAGGFRKLFSITIPQLAPITVLVVILQILASLKVFDQIYMMTSGGPAGATRSIVQYVYDTGFTGYRLGYAAAISYVFFVIIIIVSVVQFWFNSRRRAT